MELHLQPPVTSSPLLRPNILIALRPVSDLFDDALYSSVTSPRTAR
jgi:hypothetical protein